ncbi:hypothetical protein [Halolamina salifodinae]|uniref:Uncharacterized protein n=1 Tax=Halolamina salifodinae TaxID=1202767 RepID=A0A8T4H044_9EURY|nr:hypothetical protein [Halolamina salifodinae]MBP1986965.1 hypothetical protein [Halolamina salifodinae]
MPLVLRDRVGLFGLFPLFFLNLAVSTAAVILYRIVPIVALALAWAYLYVLLLQTRIMAVLVVTGFVTTPIIARFTDAFTPDVAVYSMGVLAASVVAAHLVAVVISALTGFRI